MLSLYSFSLPFAEPFRTPVTTITHRDGLILKYGDHYAEASPLPGFSPETIVEVTSRIKKDSEDLSHFFNSKFDHDRLKSLVRKYPELPSLQFALSMLGFKILNSRDEPAGSVIKLFEGDLSALQINEVAGSDTTIEEVSKLTEGGGKVIKFKVGGNPGKTAELLNALHRQFPELQLRLDANQSWPADRIKEYSSLFRKLPVQYIEEPAVFSGTEELKNLLELCDLPVALDESVQSLNRFKVYSSLLQKEIAAFIIKPAIFGDLPGLFETIGRQNSLVNKVVFTSAFESAGGHADIRRIATAYGSEKFAHGLGTGRFFSTDLCKTLPEYFSDLNPELLNKIDL